MLRSYSHSFKSKNKQNMKRNYLLSNASNFGFNTIWKYRNCHQLKFVSSGRVKQERAVNKINTNQSFCSTKSQAQGSQQKQQKNLKKFVKNMKNIEKIIEDVEPREQQIKKPRTSQSNRLEPNSKIAVQKNIEIQQFTRMQILQNYGRRIEELLRLKILKKTTQNKMFMTRDHNDQFDKELAEMMNHLQFLAHSQQIQKSEQKQNLELQQVEKRIQIYEKLIAESLTESEMLKRYYYSKRSLAKSSGIKNRSHLNIKTQKHQNMTFTSSIGSLTAINYETTNQYCYKKPCKQNYKKNQRMTQSYIHNRQQVPRSMYQSQFLNYGSLPIYKHQQAQHNSQLICGSQVRDSVYRNDFKQKKCVLIDQQDLDCKHDKIKTSNISFIQKKAKNKPIAGVFIAQDILNTSNTCKLKKTKKGGNQSMVINCPDSSNNKQIMQNKQNRFIKFLGQSEKQAVYNNKKLVIDNIMKDRNLNTLKYSYKNIARF